MSESREESYFCLNQVEPHRYPFIDIDWTQDALFLSKLRKSWHDQYAEYLGADAATNLLEQLHRTGKIYEHDVPGTLIASDKGTPVGIAAIRRLPEISLITLYEVIPDYRGKGVGQQLLEAVCTVSGPLVAHVSIHRPWLISIYERHGFKSLGTEPVDHFGHELIFQVVAKA